MYRAFPQAVANNADVNPACEIRSLFKIPQGIRNYCETEDGPLNNLYFRVIETDLNGDGTPEYILDPQTVEKDQKTIDEDDRSWQVLFKTFTGNYISIGTIPRPVLIQKHDKGWSDIVCRDSSHQDSEDEDEDEDEDEEKEEPSFLLYDFFLQHYRLAAKLERPAEDLTPEKAYALLNESKNSRFQSQPEDRRKLLYNMAELATSMDFFKEVIDNMPSELKAGMLQSMIQPVKDIESSFIRSHHAMAIAKQLLELKEYDQAAEMFDVALEACIQDSPDAPDEYAELLCQQAVAYSQADQKSKSLSKWEDALKYYRMAAVKEPELLQDVGTALANIAIFHHNENNTEEFRQKAHESLDIFENLQIDDLSLESSVAFAAISGLLAKDSESDVEAADMYYTRALILFDKIKFYLNKITDVANFANIMANAARFHQAHGQIDRAANEMKNAMNLYCICNENADFLSNIFSCGEDLVILLYESRDEESANHLLKQLEDLPGGKDRFYTANFSFMNQFANTCILFHNPQQALEIIQKCFQSVPSMSAQNQTMLMVTKAKALHELKQYPKAIELLENFLNTKPASNVNLPSVHYNLGRTYFSIGNLDKAEKSLVNALALCKEYDITSEITALCHSKLSDVYAAQKNADAAAKEFKEALKFYEKEYKGKLQYSQEYLTCMNNMASFLHNAGRTEGAFALQQKIVSLLEDNDNDYLPFKSVKAQVFKNYGNICSDLEKYEEAEKYYSMALEIYESTMDSDKARTPDSINLQADILFNRGNNYGKLNKNDLAEKDYLASARLYHELGEKTGLPAHFLQESKPLNNLASLLADQKRYDEAEKVYANVIKLREENAKDDSDRLQLAKAIFNYAHDLMQKDDDGTKAFTMFEKGLKISRELNDDVLTARFLTFCAICSDNDEVGKKHYEEAWQLLEKHPDDPNANVVREILDSIKQHFTDDKK